MEIEYAQPGCFYPILKPRISKHLSVSNGHEITFSEYGDSGGMPLILLHGGPGTGCSPSQTKFFDGDKWRLIFPDQRGCGQSQPLQELAYNETKYLVEDIRSLMEELRLNKVVLWGASWGTTLASVYSQKYPETVSGMILRGVFHVVTTALVDYISNYPHKHFVKEWERFVGVIPVSQRRDVAKHFLTALRFFGSKRKKYAYEWVRYEMGLSFLEKKSEEELDKTIREFDYETLALVEGHYIANNCFLEDKQILKNVTRFPKVPVAIINGRYDMVCPQINAIVLHEAIPSSELYLTTAGHASTDPGNAIKLLEETDKLYHRLA